MPIKQKKMGSSGAIAVSILAVKVLRIILIITTVIVIAGLVVQLFEPEKFIITYPISFEIYKTEEINYGNGSLNKLTIGPLSLKNNDIPDSETIINNATGQVKINGAGGAVSLIYAVVIILILLTLFYVLNSLLKFLNTVEEGNPFVYDNVKRFRYFGIISIVLALIYIIMKFSIGFIISSQIQLPSNLIIDHTFDFNWELILLGIILIVIAETFKIGTSVKSENDLTI